MREVKWLATLVGEPLAFADVSAIKQGETARLTDEDAARAVASGLAQYVEETAAGAPTVPEAGSKSGRKAGAPAVRE